MEERPGDAESLTLNILPTFEDGNCLRERELGEQMWRARVEKDRRERKMREGSEVRLAFHSRSTTLTRSDTLLGSLARTHRSG